ncbi:MGH1-like glycoside hydrolase domain-containing protein [Jiella avicenniae]|uniref:Glycoside hydrolase family 37 n=1 Tax=Jiella avicenniae TaxID=2907202 RepID=A0A9X1TDC8_9HYPH|nr:trehalase family glycosidase [Jiella avicenniae]MCE7029983.1 glycoside hydrolase family 37 [Jiella avicenniae]
MRRPLIDPTIPADRAWNTWSDRPAEMVFLPLGVRITPVIYSTSARKATTIGARDSRLGRHAIDGSLIGIETTHAGTRLSLSYEKSGDPFAVAGRWEGLELGEWGLRFWVTICLSADGGETVTYQPDERAALVKIGQRFVALVAEEEPVQVTTHQDVAALAADFEANGYFHLASRGTAGPTIGLRFNLEMMRNGRFAAAVADRADLAVAKAREALAAACLDEAARPPAEREAPVRALEAVRDVMAWNTVWDPVNRRPYTAVSRIWNLGEFAVWYNDQTYHALMAGLFDRELARVNLAAAMVSATPQGNFACIVTSNDAWVDRTQTPNGAFVLWLLYLRTGERSLLESCYAPLARNQRWWRAHRDPTGAGLVSCGTSDVGEALYKGTAFGARNETGMDNSATHDEAAYDPATRTLSTFDVGLNASLALDAEMLALIAAEMGRSDEAEEFGRLAEETRRRIREELWDESRGLFANRQRSGGFVKSVGPTSFYPLACGAATPDQAASLLRHLADPATFGGRFVIPNAARDDPAYRDNVYWRGRIWPNVNWFVWQGLRRYGFDADAAELARKSLALFEASWANERIAAENYDAETGSATDQVDADRFYGWSAMLPLIATAAVMDFSPWHGWSVTNAGSDVVFGPVESPLGRISLTVRDGTLRLTRGADAVFETDRRGAFTEIVFGPGSFSCRVPGGEVEATLALPQIPASAFVAARLGAQTLSADPASGHLALRLPPSPEAEPLVVWFGPRTVSNSGNTPR